MVKVFPVFLVLFVAAALSPAYYGYDKTNDEVYYDMGECLPQDIEYVIANTRLRDEFDIASTHMLLVDANLLPPRNSSSMIQEMEKVDGVKYVLGLRIHRGSAQQLPDGHAARIDRFDPAQV